MKPKKKIPFEFVLDALADALPQTKPMFGCTAVYVRDKIVLILRDRDDSPEDRGVWLATSVEHHKSLQEDFSSMRSLKLFGSGLTGWQVLPVEADGFEASALKACDLILEDDPRIGKIPKSRKVKSKSTR